MDQELQRHLRELAQLRVAVQDAEDAVRTAEENLKGFIAHHGASVSRDLLGFLYWHGEVRCADAFVQALGAKHRNSLGKLFAQDAPIVAICDRCDAEIRATSHNNYVETRRAQKRSDEAGIERHSLCSDCKQRRGTFATEHWHKETERRKERVRQLRSMPYAQYLQTDEWQATRKLALRRARYACQVCNASGTQLDVHHRTYERRGQERSDDLTVLCHDCHGVFHGKIDKVPT